LGALGWPVNNRVVIITSSPVDRLAMCGKVGRCAWSYGVAHRVFRHRYERLGSLSRRIFLCPFLIFPPHLCDRFIPLISMDRFPRAVSFAAQAVLNLGARLHEVRDDIGALELWVADFVVAAVCFLILCPLLRS
jgi:hypothetical protein